METSKVICVVCPNGCEISVDHEIQDNELKVLNITGNKCERGEKYAESEIICPVRTLTSTVAIADGMFPRLPVKSAEPIPKASMMEAMREIRKKKVTAPVFMGDVIISNVAGTGIDIIAEKNG